MKILCLGLDNSALDNNSALGRRTADYGELVEKYDVIVPSATAEEAELSKKAKVYGSGGGNKLARFIEIYNLAKKLLREEKYDIITAQDQYYLALIGVCLAKKFNLGLEIQIHGWEKYYGLRKLIAKYVLARAGAVRAVSRRLKRQLLSEFKVAENKITVVPIYSEPGIRKQEAGVKENKNKFIFLTAGRLMPVKNIALQIEAMAEVVKKYSNIELWIVGDGLEFNNLKFKIKNLKLDDNIKLLGKKSREELNSIYNKADVFVLSSDSEGWGLSVIEAAVAGLPIIMTDVGSAGEVIKDFESGLVIPVGDKLKLVDAMLKIIEDESLRKKLGEGAKLAVSRLLTKEQTLALYKKSWEIASNELL